MTRWARETVQLLTHSPDHMLVLATITATGPVTPEDLPRGTGITWLTITRILQELEERNLVIQTNDRYTATDLGRLLADRLGTVFDAIATMQSLLVILREFPADQTDGPLHPTGPIQAITTADPTAPTRRFGDLLQAATRIRLVAPTILPELAEIGGMPTASPSRCEIVVPIDALKPPSSPSQASPLPTTTIITDSMTVLTVSDEISHIIGLLDDLAVIGVSDTTGRVGGFIETRDDRIRAQSEATITGITRKAAPVRGNLTL